MDSLKGLSKVRDATEIITEIQTANKRKIGYLDNTLQLSIVLPAKNEAIGLSELLPRLHSKWPNAEITVVDDGSVDRTSVICEQHYVNLVQHPYSMGNGAAIKSGARAASGDILVFMDADGQHNSRDIKQLIEKLQEGYDMVVGARSKSTHANLWRWLANSFYNRAASWMTGQRVEDLTSGFRVVKAGKFREFLYLLPNGFSYPTTITMAFFRSGYSVGYVPINAHQRQGKSHIRLLRDGLRFLLIIFKIGTLYSPLKLFLPISAFFFFLGTFYYLWTYFSAGRFTNMSALLLSTSVIIFLIGLVSEQITTLLYTNQHSRDLPISDQ